MSHLQTSFSNFSSRPPTSPRYRGAEHQEGRQTRPGLLVVRRGYPTGHTQHSRTSHDLPWALRTQEIFPKGRGFKLLKQGRALGSDALSFQTCVVPGPRKNGTRSGTTLRHSHRKTDQSHRKTNQKVSHSPRKGELGGPGVSSLCRMHSGSTGDLDFSSPKSNIQKHPAQPSSLCFHASRDDFYVTASSYI